MLDEKIIYVLSGLIMYIYIPSLIFQTFFRYPIILIDWIVVFLMIQHGGWMFSTLV